MEFRELEKHVIKWADDKGILDKATPLTQLAKTEEEVSETKEALYAASQNYISFLDSKNNVQNTKQAIKDGYGDQLVTILIGCKLSGVDPLECLEIAYNEIKDRQGEMINGTFIKN